MARSIHVDVIREQSWTDLLARAAEADHLGDELQVSVVWAEIHRRATILMGVVRRGMPRLTAADADDIVQFVMARLREEKVFQALQASETPNSYVMRMVRNRALDVARLESRHVPLDFEPVQDAPQEAKEPPDVDDLLNTVTKAERDLLIMHFWDDMSMVEIAAVLDLPYSTVAKRSFRLLARLRKRFETPN